MKTSAAEFTKKLFLEAFEISTALFRIMVPLIVVVKILQETGGIAFLGNLLAPVMQIVGLPGSMGLVWATAILANNYAGAVVFISLMGACPVTVAQTTIIALMMLVAHNLPVELRIAQKAGARFRFMFLVRVCGAFLFGWVAFRIYQLGGWFQGLNTAKWVPPIEESSLSAWAVSQLRELILIFFIILGLVLLLKILARVGITEIMIRFLNPILKLLGIGPSASTITIIGMTLGIAYGGGLIIKEAASGRLDQRDVLFSLTLMGLSHSLIEDTLLMAILGADIFGVLWGRLILTLLTMFFLVKLVTHLPEPVLSRFVVREPKM
jgi:hypothetical protein